MGMEMKLQFKMSQQLVMTPQLVQAIRLLQLSRLELVEEMRKELDGNPVLADDIAEPQRRARASGAPASHRAQPRRSAGAGRKAARDERPRGARDRETGRRTSTGSSSSRTATSSRRRPRDRGGFEELPPIEQSLTKPSNAARVTCSGSSR
jgi:RNA polymerase sigma-54 factor